MVHYIKTRGFSSEGVHAVSMMATDRQGVYTQYGDIIAKFALGNRDGVSYACTFSNDVAHPSFSEERFERSVAAIISTFESARNADHIYFSVGSIKDKRWMCRDLKTIATPAISKWLIQARAVGEVNCRPFDEQGNPVYLLETDNKESVIGLNLQDLTEASEKTKVNLIARKTGDYIPLIVALRCKAGNRLYTDHSTAQYLLTHAK